MDLRISQNKITNFEALFYSPFKTWANIYVDQRQYYLIQNNKHPNILKLIRE